MIGADEARRDSEAMRDIYAAIKEEEKENKLKEVENMKEYNRKISERSN